MNIWTIVGLLLLLIAFIGVAVPLLPTTPFVLLGAFCFARSSPRLHRWLLDSALFGPVLQDWESKQCVTLNVKWLALTMMLVVGGSSIWFFIPLGWPRMAALGMIGLGCLSVVSLKTCPRNVAVKVTDENSSAS
ncbi:MAG: YbaN family protein [Gammaproteobacteria bacterium]|nr:YbaN family protein [Gammaproteobacteria bacterium]